MRKVLLVDDEKNIRLVVGKSLEKGGYEVIYAVDGVEAVEKSNKLKPALVLLDIRLPKMNGFLVLEALKSDDTTKDIPVVILSAHAEDADIQKALSLGASDYLVKPVTQSELLTSVEENIKEEEDNEE